MTNRMRQGCSRWGACGVVVIGMLIILGLVGLYWFTPFGKPVPTVQILQPTRALDIQSGQAVVLTVQAHSRSGVGRIDFFVDDVLVNRQVSEQAQQEVLDGVFLWFSSQPGAHRLSVVAYDQAGTASLPGEVLVVVRAREAGLAVGLPGNAEGGDAGSDGRAASDGGSNISLDQILEDARGAEQFPVEIPGQPVDMLPEITMFQVQVERSGNLVIARYSVIASDDLGLAEIKVFLSSLDDPLVPASINYITCGRESPCSASGGMEVSSGGWLLSAMATDSSGQVSATRTRQIHVLVGEDEPGIALEDEGASIQLDPNLPWDEVQFVDTEADDLGTPRIAEYGCGGQTVVLEVPYKYVSDHGEDVYVEARAESGNMMVAAGNVRIQHGSGIARIEMGQIVPESINTENLELLMKAGGGDYFYTEQAEFPLIWPTPLADLRILSADIRSDAQIVSIQNMGCASVDGVSVLLRPLDSAGESIFLDTIIPAGGSYDWLPLTDPNLFARGFEIVVDPNNAITEINEDNNSYEAGPLNLKYIHIYRIDIHDTRDDEWHQDSDDGEFQLTAFVGGEYAYRPRVRDANWVLRKGSYEIDGLVDPIFLSPTLDWDQDLMVALELWERDDVGPADQSFVQFIHSPDMSQEDNWKNGGDFSALSDDGTFTLYWRVVVER